MLIRFIAKNLYSFKDYTEFNLLPGKIKRFRHHVYGGPVQHLKLNALYGANGSGKSNLIKALSLLQQFVKKGKVPNEFITDTFRFDENSAKSDVYLGIEFIKDNTPYYYGVTVNQGVILEEELEISGLGKGEDQLLFRRTDNGPNEQIDLEFSSHIETDKEASLFPFFLKSEFLNRNTSVLSFMKKRQSHAFEIYRNAALWFVETLSIVQPGSKPINIALTLEQSAPFRSFANQIMKTFNTGVQEICIQDIPLEEYFGKDDKKQAEIIASQLKVSPEKATALPHNGELISFVMKEDEPFAKIIALKHIEDDGKTKFQLGEESDGTRRLLDFLPVFYGIINHDKVYVIDEIERSIHPVLIKELIKKFSHDQDTSGQLIFSTHESNLLDQDIFRPDEIWFAEKKNGATCLFPLSDFREHHTIDIKRGYLNGRYGGIPFLGNLQDLNWNINAEAN